MARHVSLMVIMAVACFLGLSFMMSFGGSATSIIHHQPPPPPVPPAPPAPQGKAADTLDVSAISSDLLTGTAVAPKFENATLKYACPSRTVPTAPRHPR